jgi:hypothetical protein
MEWTREKVIELLDRNPRAVERAIVALYNLQTADEQAAGITRLQNGAGFSAFDAKAGTYYAEWILSGKRLSGKYLAKAREMAKKYVGQLVAIAASR